MTTVCRRCGLEWTLRHGKGTQLGGDEAECPGAPSGGNACTPLLAHLSRVDTSCWGHLREEGDSKLSGAGHTSGNPSALNEARALLFLPWGGDRMLLPRR